jgi:predicted RNase H-like nuclease (RuvC/YqgF family)
LDEISSLQDQLSRKDYDLSKLNKEIDRWRSKAEDKDDLRMGKKSELREEIERLENELIRKEKKLFEEVE